MGIGIASLVKAKDIQIIQKYVVWQFLAFINGCYSDNLHTHFCHQYEVETIVNAKPWIGKTRSLEDDSFLPYARSLRASCMI